MNWSQEIIRALFVAFGFMEITTNARYLLKKDGMIPARKQHGELPPDVSITNLKIKVKCMLTVGIVFFLAGLLCYLNHTYYATMLAVCTILLVIYAIIEAFVYKYWKTIGFSIMSLCFCLIVFLCGR